MSNKSAINNRLDQIDNDYQLVIIGGGIYGATLCWEAAHRGIKTLLVEQDDYACGASSNNLKTIHGGLRSLQSLNLNAVLKGIRERSIFLRIAPNYVKPLPCILPTTSSLMKSKPVVGAGLLLYNALSQINSLLSGSNTKIPGTHLLSRRRFIKKIPHINTNDITGGALWHDAQVQNTERLVWQFIKSAIKKGAVAVNHTAALEHKHNKSNDKHNVLLRDQITGDEKTVTTSVIVDSSAAWDFIKHCLPTSEHDEDLTFLKSVNIIVKKNIFDTAVGINIKANNGNSRLYFFSPWRNCTIIGTWYSSVEPYPDNSFSQSEAVSCIDEINTAFNQEILTLDDICNVHIGFLPAEKIQHNDSLTLDKDLLSHYQLHNWPNIPNVYSLRGTKYTFARHDAERVVDQISKTMAWSVSASQSDHLPIYQTLPTIENTHPLSAEVIDNLLTNYGSDTELVLNHIKKNPQSVEPIPGTQYHIMAEIYYTVFYEQTLTLCDLLKRRLDIGDRAPPDLATAQYCAKVMQPLLSWSDETVQTQISELYSSYPAFLVQEITSALNNSISHVQL